jgi:hypothetical protein
VLLQTALSHWHQRRYDDSLLWATRALELDPKLLLAREHVIGAYWMKGDVDRMLTESVTQAQSFGAPREALDEVRRLCESLKQGYASAGRIGAARIMRDFASRNLQPAAAIQLPILSGEMGDLDAGFGHLDRALDSLDPSLVHLAVAPQWDSLRGDPRFGDRLARMGLSTRNAKASLIPMLADALRTLCNRLHPLRFAMEPQLAIKCVVPAADVFSGTTPPGSAPQVLDSSSVIRFNALSLNLAASLRMADSPARSICGIRLSSASISSRR